MGRFFSTIYHTIFVIVSISALVLTIMSATSCAFVKFDHQYKGDGRLLLSLKSVYHHRRALQDTTDAAADATADEMMEDAFQSDMAEDEMTPDELADMVEDVPDDIALDQGLGPDVTALTEDSGQPAVDEPADDEPDTTAPGDVTMDVDSALDGIANEGPDSSTTMTAAEEDETSQSIAAPSPNDIAEDEGVDFSAPTMDEGEGSDETGSGKVASMPEDDQSASFGEPEDYESSNTFGEPMAGQGSTSSGTSEDTPGTEQSGMYGSSSSTSTAASAMDEEAVAQVSGDAGLFCDGERSFSISNLWKGSLSDLENTIAMESDMNQSEEIARNAVIMATIFGTMAAFILVVESIVGWTICCEKWIIGLIALCACICQGITFLFFNSERYCDGDIVNEILNQEPCVVGQGGLFSIIAIVLYALMIVLACRLPQDDPYSPCCKKNNVDKDSVPSSSSSDSRKGFGLLSSKNSSSDNGNPANGKPERPNWLSEEAAENEII